MITADRKCALYQWVDDQAGCVDPMQCRPRENEVMGPEVMGSYVSGPGFVRNLVDMTCQDPYRQM